MSRRPQNLIQYWPSLACSSPNSPINTGAPSKWHTPNIATKHIAIAKSSVAKSSRYRHHHLGDYDYAEDIDKNGFDDPVNENDDSGVTLVSVYGIW